MLTSDVTPARVLTIALKGWLKCVSRQHGLAAQKQSATASRRSWEVFWLASSANGQGQAWKGSTMRNKMWPMSARQPCKAMRYRSVVHSPLLYTNQKGSPSVKMSWLYFSIARVAGECSTAKSNAEMFLGWAKKMLPMMLSAGCRSDTPRSSLGLVAGSPSQAVAFFHRVSLSALNMSSSAGPCHAEKAETTLCFGAAGGAMPIMHAGIMLLRRQAKHHHASGW